MHLIRLVAVMALTCCFGCGTLSRPTADAPYRLPPEESAFGRSLAHFAHGLLLEREGRPDGGAAALEAFRQATALDATNALLKELLVGRLWLHEQHAEALAEAQQQCRDQPSEQAHALVATLAEELEDYPLAARHYTQAARYHSRQAEQWHHLQVRSWVRAGNDRQALRSLRQSPAPQTAATMFAHPLFWGEQLLRLKGEQERATPYFKLALKSATNQQQRLLVCQGLARSDLAAGATNAARKHLQQALSRAPDDLESIVYLMRFDYATRGAAATNLWRQAAAARPPDLYALQALTYDAASRGDHQTALHYGALAYNLLARQRTGPAPHASSYYSHLHELAGSPEESAAVLRQALRQHPTSALLQNHLAYLLAVHNRELDEAEALVRRALIKEPQNGAYLDTLGWVLYRKGEYGAALELLLQAAHLEGDDPTILDHIGDVCLALGRHTEAIAFWQKSLLVKPHNREIEAKLAQHNAVTVEETP